MLKIKTITITFLLLSYSTTLATVTETSPPHNTSMPPPNYRGDLGLIIVASDSPQFVEEWVTTRPKHAPLIKRIFSAKPDQLIVSAFIVTGLSANDSGKYAFTVSFYLLDPNGKPLFGQKDYAKGTGKLPNHPTFIMADPALDIVLENSDPPGVYTIVGQATDLVSGQKADHFYNIRLDKYE